LEEEEVARAREPAAGETTGGDERRRAAAAGILVFVTKLRSAIVRRRRSIRKDAARVSNWLFFYIFFVFPLRSILYVSESISFVPGATTDPARFIPKQDGG
jgi:hypothetical protein